MPSDTRAPLRDAVRVFNKHVLNPVILRVAGRKHFYASVIRHTGRVSGKRYMTPVVADEIVGGYLIPLPYGVGTDWLRNVVFAKRAAIISAGKAHEVSDPQILDAPQAICQLPGRRQRVYERFGVEKFLKVTVVQGS